MGLTITGIRRMKNAYCFRIDFWRNGLPFLILPVYKLILILKTFLVVNIKSPRALCITESTTQSM